MGQQGSGHVWSAYSRRWMQVLYCSQLHSGRRDLFPLYGGGNRWGLACNTQGRTRAAAGGRPGVRCEKMLNRGYQKLLGFTLERESSPHVTPHGRLRGLHPRVRNKREGGGRPGMWQRARSKGKLIFPPFCPK